MRGSARSTVRLLSVVFLGTCWPADLPVPSEQLHPVWTHELTRTRAPAHIGLLDDCVIWLLSSQSNQLERWSCAGERLAALSAATGAGSLPPALLVQHNGTVSLWSRDLRPLLMFGDTSTGSTLSGNRKLPLRALTRAFLDQSLSLYCGEHYARGALEENRIRTIAWRGSADDWVDMKQLASVASSVLPRGSATISLTGLAGRSTRCLVNRQDEVVIAWLPPAAGGPAPDSSTPQLVEALERISAGAPAERVKFLDAAYDHNRDELWLRQHRIARPRAVQFLLLTGPQAGSRRRVGTRAVQGTIEAFAASEGDVYLLTRNDAGGYSLGRYAVRPSRSND